MSMYGNGSMDQTDSLAADASMQDAFAMAQADSFIGDMANDMMPFEIDLNDLPDPDDAGFAPMHNPPNPVQPTIEDNDDNNGLQSPDKLSGAGAGPLPTGFAVQLPPNAGNTLTEFTKRRNWSQRVLDELKDFLHILTPDGRISYVSPSTKTLTGHESSELVGRFITDFVHPDDGNLFIREFNESIASGNPLRFFSRFRKADNSYMIFESHGHPHFGSDAVAFGNSAGASFCRGFFMMSRPYPTKNAALLDSFLEHKIENERLKKRIADLKREEKEDLEGQQPRPVGKDQPAISSSPTDYKGMPPPAKPPVSHMALTQQNLDEALAESRPYSINDKMARYEGATHVETIELLTGLRYREGERSKGISTGATSPSLQFVRGDAGIPIQVDKDGRPVSGGRADDGSPFDGPSGDRKKKMKVADEYVCTDCGTLDSPEWRKGPNGPKTLCNACGLRWAKKEKKRSGPCNTNGANDAHTRDISSAAAAAAAASTAQVSSGNLHQSNQNIRSGASAMQEPSASLDPKHSYQGLPPAPS